MRASQARGQARGATVFAVALVLLASTASASALTSFLLPKDLDRKARQHGFLVAGVSGGEWGVRHAFGSGGMRPMGGGGGGGGG
jgi:hypothetical protein